MVTSVLFTHRDVPEPPEHAAYLIDRLRDRILHDAGANLYAAAVCA